MNNLDEECKKVLSGELSVDELFKDCHTRRSKQELHSLASRSTIFVVPEDIIGYLEAYINGENRVLSEHVTEILELYLAAWVHALILLLGVEILKVLLPVCMMQVAV